MDYYFVTFFRTTRGVFFEAEEYVFQCDAFSLAEKISSFVKKNPYFKGWSYSTHRIDTRNDGIFHLGGYSM